MSSVGIPGSVSRPGYHRAVSGTKAERSLPPFVIMGKLVAPTLPQGVVRRPRLDDQLSAGERLALVVAPPGYGKTVAVRQWIETDGLPTSWFALDLLDDNPDLFWLHFIRALRNVLPDLDDEPEVLLAERGPRDHLFLAVLITEIERDGRRHVVVLDDVAHVTDRSVLDGIALLVDRVGHLLRFVLIGRFDPALPIARWRSAGWLGEIREADLRFSDTEALAAAGTFAGLRVSAEAVIALNKRTEGWPAGLHLALLSIRNAPDPDAAALEVAGSDRLLADYLVAEVLDRLPAAERDVALALSVLDWFDPRLCQELLGKSAVPLARKIARRRMFLTIVDEGTGAMRFHSLFRELLESELRWRDPERRTDLHRRAAVAWADRGELSTAYRHLMTIGEEHTAFELLVRPALELVDRGDRSGLAQKMRTLSPSMQVDSPWLAFDLAVAWFFAGSEADATRWCDRASELMSLEDPAARLRLHTTRCLLALMRGELGLAAEHVDGYEQFVQHVGKSDHIEVRFATIAARVALASRRFDEARVWVERAKTISDPESVTSVTVPALEAWLELEVGDRRAATKHADGACAAAERLRMRPHHGAFDALVVAASCHLAAGDTRKAGVLAERARSDAAVLGFPWNRVRAAVLAAEVRRLTSGPRSSLAIVDDLRVEFPLGVPGDLGDDVDVVEAKALIGSGEHAAARRLVESLADGPRKRLLTARLVPPDGAGDSVDRLLEDRRGWTVAERLEAEVLVGLADSRSGVQTRLWEALAEGSSTGWVSPFLGHGDAANQLLRQVPTESLHPVLAGVLRPQHQPMRMKPDLSEPLTRRELTILELLPTHLSYAQIGGRLHLSINTVKGNLKSIYRKLDVGSRTDAVDAASQAGLL